MFIGELAGFAVNQGSTWVAHVVVTVLDADDEPVAGAMVSGAWSEGDTDTASCTTDETGACELESDSIRKRVSTVVFEIINLEAESLSYLPELDNVGDPGEQPRSISIAKP